MRSRINFTAIVSAALFIWFALFQLYPFARTFQADSEGLVVTGIRDRAAGTSRYGGFLGEGYLSQYGLQGKIFSALHPRDMALERYVFLARGVTSALFALTLAVFVMIVLYEFGSLAAGTLFGGMLISPWLAFFAPNLYWIIFTHFLPFVLAWALYPRFKNRLPTFLAIIGFLVFIKALSGYEYISNVILSPAVALVYYELKDGTDRRTLVKKTFAVILAGIIGFAASLGLHLYQGAAYLESWPKAVQAIAGRAAGRTIGQNIAETTRNYWTTLPYYVIGFAPLPGARVDILARIRQIGAHLIAVLPMALSLPFLFRRWRDRAFTALGAATIVSYFASLSWAVLAPQHMHHVNINTIIFYLPANLMLFIFIPLAIRKLFRPS